MNKPITYFSKEEFESRQNQVRKGLAERNLDGLLVFKIEDMYWLSGFDSDGFCIFHNMFIGVNGEMTHLSRPADIGNVNHSSICQDIRISTDKQGEKRSDHIKDMLAAHGMQGKRIGIQVDTMGLTPKLFLEIQETLEGWCELVITDGFIRINRLIKSSQELEYIRKAGQILDIAASKAVDAVRPGVMDGEVYAAFYDTLFKMDADLPAHIPPMGSGDSAMNIRYTTGRTLIKENDQMTLELGLGYRHYHAASMCVALTGPEIDPMHLKMHEACVVAIDEVQKILRSGTSLNEVYETYRRVAADFGIEHTVLTACGYTMGATWPPTWMEQPMIYPGNETVLEQNMTFFTHMILNDHETGLLMAVGEQAIVTEGAPEIVSHISREPIIVEG
ncbi:MAG: M24 family metallopeptidase [Gammaproteobacteria bacterium]|nr:M24 family metallopeptidase [Gammaproteobacteria bacterium]